MANYIRGTNPPTKLSFYSGVDFTSATDINVTFSHGDYEINFTGADVTVLSETDLQVQLTQEQSLALFNNDACIKPAEVQVNYMLNGYRYGSYPSQITGTKNLLDEVIGA